MLHFLGASGAGRLLIEGAEIILRGEIRARLPRATISSVRVAGDDLVLDTARGPLVATLGGQSATRLARVLCKPVPTLAEKLGLGPGKTASCLWPATDTALNQALAGYVAPVAEAHILVAEVLLEDQLAQVIAQLAGLAGRPLWCVNAKGASVALPEARIRTALRAAGWIDSKTTAVSDTASATRYAPRKDGTGLAARTSDGHMKAARQPRRAP